MDGKRLRTEVLQRRGTSQSAFPPPQWNPVFAKTLAFMMAGALGAAGGNDAHALSPADADAIPHVGKKARENFVHYQYAGNHRAFAIAPGGAWSWQADQPSEEVAANSTLQSCQSHTQQKCVLYALNDRIVFDADKWPTLWGPYVDDSLADRAPAGTAVGQRFPDLVWFDAARRPVTLSRLRGKVVFLHFWGSWCPPCMREFPTLQSLQAQIGKRLPADVEMVLLQVREPFTQSRKWVEEYGFTGLPLYDSGVTDDDATALSVSNGERINDRDIARVFPTTYVLDRNGLVIFSHHGPVADWLEYLAFFEHAAASTAPQQGFPAPSADEPQP